MLKRLRESSNPAESYQSPGKFTLTKFISVLAGVTGARAREREPVDRIVEEINGLR